MDIVGLDTNYIKVKSPSNSAFFADYELDEDILLKGTNHFDLSLPYLNSSFYSFHVNNEYLYPIALACNDSISFSIKRTSISGRINYDVQVTGTNALAHQIYRERFVPMGRYLDFFDKKSKHAGSYTNFYIDSRKYIDSVVAVWDSLKNAGMLTDDVYNLYYADTKAALYLEAIKKLGRVFKPDSTYSLYTKWLNTRQVMYHYGDGANKLLLRTRNGVHLHRTYLKTLVDLDENIKDPLIKKASLGFFYLYDTSYRELAWGSYLYFLEQSFPSITGKGYPDTKAFKAYYPNSKYLIKLQQLQDSIIQERESIMSDRIVDTTTYSNLQSIMDKSEGRYFFIDVWATWCLPCIAEFNHLPALNSFFNKLNIKQVFLSVDELPRKKEWVDFIELQKLPGHHFIINSKVQREILNLMNKGQVSGNLSVPRYLFYDKEKNKYHTEVPRPSTGVVFEDAIKKFMVTE